MWSKIQKLLIVLPLLSNMIFAYELAFQNFTQYHLVIASKKRAAIGSEKTYQIVAPFESVTQVWDDANCLESLQWALLNKNLPLKGGLDLVDENQGYQIPRDKQKVFDETFFNKTTGRGLYLWNSLPIKMVENELFNKTAEAAIQLAKGIDAGICETLNTLSLKMLSKINPPTSEQQCFFNLAGLVDASAEITKISICKSRTFLILDTGTLNKLTRKPQLIAETTKGE